MNIFRGCFQSEHVLFAFLTQLYLGYSNNIDSSPNALRTQLAGI